MYVCIYTHMYTVCVYIYIYTCILYIPICIYIYIYTHVYMSYTHTISNNNVETYYTPDITTVKVHWEIPPKVHGTFPVKIHRTGDNPLEKAADM